MKFSPRLDHRLVETVQAMDVERLSIAAVWRLAGATAAELGLCRPGYHSVLRITLEERERRAARREAISDAVSELWSYTGTDYETVVRRLVSARRP